MQLQELKKTYDACKASKEAYSTLLETREAVHAQIELLKEKRAAALFTQKGLPEGLEELRARLQSLDHQIDTLGEQHEERVEELKEALVTQIQQIHPSSSQEYARLSQQLAIFKQEKTASAALLERLAPFYAALKEGAATKGVRTFFSGRNPKAALARAVQKAAEEAERVRPHLKEESLQRFIAAFLTEAHHPWNRALYRDRFYQLYDEFCQIRGEIEERRKSAQYAIAHAEKEIEEWIEGYCSRLIFQ